MTVTGWLFDAYANKTGMTVWLIDLDGRKHKMHYPFRPCFYLQADSDGTKLIEQLRQKLPSPISLKQVIKKELYANKEIPVLEVSIHQPLQFQAVVRKIEEHFSYHAFYNADIKVMQMFYYMTDLFPLAYGEYDVEENTLKSWKLYDSFDAERYSLPELVTMSISPSVKLLEPKYQRNLEIEIAVEGRKVVIEQHSPIELIEQVNDYLTRYDPDIILTSYGDSALLPMLFELAQKHRLPLYLNRDTDAVFHQTKAMSYFSYGQIKHRAGMFELAGRWHVDKENSFIVGEADLEGLYELARISQISMQHQARTSIGSALSSMQIAWTYRNNYLVPYKKPVVEAFKSFETLLKSDRGGLHFMPIVGYHEQVAELDFASMYPTIMKIHNISPETINCPCCPDSKKRVPEIDYRICEKRIGLVPSVLEPILRKRARYKKLKKEAPTKELKEKYDKMQSALKWILVTCFGYLGFKKSRLGRIEAHEAVNAYSRRDILRAKEIAEDQGYELIHGIVDCVWLKKKGAMSEDYEKLALQIEQDVGIKLSFEGIYKWILFPSSKMDEDLPTATRYVGMYESNEFKIRGLETRRRDTTKYVKQMQQEMLGVMGKANTIQEIKSLLPEIIDVVKKYVDQLKAGNVNPYDLVVKRHISKDPFEYSNRSINAIVSQTLAESGVSLSPGESIQYIITDASGKKDSRKAVPLALYALDDGYDISKYCDMVVDAAMTLLLGLGVREEDLKEYLELLTPAEKRILRKKRMPVQTELKFK